MRSRIGRSVIAATEAVWMNPSRLLRVSGKRHV